MGGERSDGQMVLRRAGPDPTRPAPRLRRRFWRRCRDVGGEGEADHAPPHQTRPRRQAAAGYDGGGTAVAEEESLRRRGAQTAVSSSRTALTRRRRGGMGRPYTRNSLRQWTMTLSIHYILTGWRGEGRAGLAEARRGAEPGLVPRASGRKERLSASAPRA